MFNQKQNVHRRIKKFLKKIIQLWKNILMILLKNNAENKGFRFVQTKREKQLITIKINGN